MSNDASWIAWIDKRRFWFVLYLAALWGVFVGYMFHAPALFVTNAPLYIPLIVPSVLAGLLLRWKGIWVCVVLHLIVASMLLGQLLWGEAFDWYYVINFAFPLSFFSVLFILPWSLLATVSAILCVLAGRYYRTRGDESEDMRPSVELHSDEIRVTDGNRPEER